MALRKIPMTMQDWETRLNRFIAATDREMLQDAGKVTAEIAKAHAESEFEKYRIVQDRLFDQRVGRNAQRFRHSDGGLPCGHPPYALVVIHNVAWWTQRAEGPQYTSLGHRPRLGKRGCQGLKARPIDPRDAGVPAAAGRNPRWRGLSALPLIRKQPGALPQAGMETRRWRWSDVLNGLVGLDHRFGQRVGRNAQRFRHPDGGSPCGHPPYALEQAKRQLEGKGRGKKK
jgi:hypothetical protein